MKKLLFIALLLVLSGVAFGESICSKNNNCTVTGSWWFTLGNAPPAGDAVFEGDSITAGNVVPAGQDWPTYAMTMPWFRNLTKYNVATGGDDVEGLTSEYASQVKSHCQAATTVRPTFLFVEIGHNNLNADAETGATVFGLLKPYWTQAKADGCKVVAFTVKASTAITGAKETERINLNRLIRFDTTYDYLIDLDALFTDPTDTNIISDGTHPTGPANIIFARYVSNAMTAGGSLGKANETKLYPYASAGLPATGINAGDGSFSRTATTGVGYFGSDGNCFLFRVGSAVAQFRGCAFGPNATGSNPTNAQAGDGFDVRSSTVGVHFFGSDNGAFINRNGNATTVTFPGTTTVTNGLTMPTLNVTTGITKSGVASSAGQCWTNIGGVEGWGACSGTTVAGVSSIRGYCLGTATSSTTVTLFNFGEVSSANCTATPSNVGAFIAAHAGTFKNLYVAATTGGVNASSGVVTLYDNGSATALTCTLGTGTSCNDTTHTVSTIAGHFYGLRVTTQTSETLASISATAEHQ